MTAKRRIVMKKFRTLIFCAAALALAGCEQIQSGLSSEQREDQARDTGAARIDGGAWYYNDADGGNVAGSANCALAISLGRRVAVAADADGNSLLSGSMAVSYTTDAGLEKIAAYKIAAGKISTASGDISAGELNASANVFKLDMAPVMPFLNGKNTNVKLSLKLSGFVCDEGSQKGRALESFNKTISMKPLWDASALAGITTYTFDMTDGCRAVIPANAKISLDGADCLQNLALSGDDSSGVKKAFFVLEETEDKKGLALRYLNDGGLLNKNFTATFSVSGIVAQNCATSYTQNFTVNFSSMKVTKDTLPVADANASSASGASFDIESMGASNDSGYLYVVLNFSNPPALYEKDNVTVLVETDGSASGDACLSKAVEWKGTSNDVRMGFGTSAALASGSNVSAQATLFVSAGRSSIATCLSYLSSGAVAYKAIDLLGATGAAVSYSDCANDSTNWVLRFPSKTLKFKIPLGDIGITSAAGAKVRLFAAVAHHGDTDSDSGMADCAPSAAVTEEGLAVASAWGDAAHNYVVDMGRAFEYELR